MSDTIALHRLTRDTAGLLADIAEDVFDEDIDPGRLAAYLDQSGALMVVAVCRGQVIGQVAAYVHNHPDQASDVYVDNLGVSPPFQRRGVARRLVDEAFAWGRDLGCRQAWIVTDPDNVAARALYEQLGAEAEPVVMFGYEL